MKIKLSFLFLAIVLTSCKGTQYYQVYKTESDTVKPRDANTISYEDSQCRIDYNLWANYGNAGFTFYNKTDKIIHLRLDESFYVLNGAAYDYYQNRIFTNGNNSGTQITRGGSVSSLGWMSLYSYASNSVISGATNSIATTEAKEIAIPPKTARSISEFDINQTIYRDCDLFLYPTARQVKGKTFNESDSPLQFYNMIAYTVDHE